MRIPGKILGLQLISYAQRGRECRQAFFLIFNLSHKLQLLTVQHNFCSVMCCTVLIWTLIWLTLGNDILLQPLHYVLTNKVNASICIRICLKMQSKLTGRFLLCLWLFCREWDSSYAVEGIQEIKFDNDAAAWQITAKNLNIICAIYTKNRRLVTGVRIIHVN